MTLILYHDTGSEHDFYRAASNADTV